MRALLRFDPDDQDEPARPQRPERPGARRMAVLALGLVETAAVGAALLAGSLFQVSSPEVALPAQARLMAAFTEIDSLVEVRRADLEGQLERGATAIEIADFPIRVAVPRDEAVDASGELDATRLTTAMLSRAAADRYASASDDRTGVSADSVFAGLSRTLSADTLTSARTALVASAAVVLALLLLLPATGGRRGWIALGVAVSAGGLITAGAAEGLASLLAQAGSDGALRAVELSIAESLLGVPLRNGLIAAAAGLVIALGGLVTSRGSGR